MAGFGRAVPGKAMGRDGRIGDREWRHCRATDETVQQDRDATMARGQHCACDSSDFPSTQPPQRLKSSGGRIGMEGEAACHHFRFPRDAGSVHAGAGTSPFGRCSAETARAQRARCRRIADPHFPKSEEHTSELQSLMRISYAVFCLKKKKHKTTYKRTAASQHERDNKKSKTAYNKYTQR